MLYKVHISTKMKIKKSIKILIMECHSGTSLCHKEIFEKLNYEVEIFPNPFSFYHYILKPIFHKLLNYFSSHLNFSNFNQLLFHTINIMTFKKMNYYHFLIYAEIKAQQEISSNMNKERLEMILNNKYYQQYFNQFEYLVCSFPPSIFQFLKIIADKFDKKIILNVAH